MKLYVVKRKNPYEGVDDTVYRFFSEWRARVMVDDLNQPTVEFNRCYKRKHCMPYYVEVLETDDEPEQFY